MRKSTSSFSFSKIFMSDSVIFVYIFKIFKLESSK